MSRPRKPWLAALLTLAQPGLGHLYVGSLSGAIGWAAAALAAVVLTPVIVIGLPIGFLAALAVWAIPTALVAGAIISAVRAGRAAPKPYTPARFNRWYAYLFAWLGSLALVQLGIRPFLRRTYEAYRIPSASMEPTILVGDFLYIHKPLTGPIHRGAIVVFASVEEDGLKVIKRVVGLPGDTIAMRNGQLLLDGSPMPEPYLPPPSGTHRTETADFREKMRRWQTRYLAGSPADYAPDLNDWGPLVLPRDSVFVLGDNRDASYDSRYWGLVSTDRILGAPALVYYSYDAGAPSIMRWLTTIRWPRIGQRFTN